MESIKKYIGHFQIYSAFILAGTSIVAGKILGSEVPVVVSVTFSLIISLIVLIPIHIRRLGMLKRISLSDLLYLFLQALTGIVLTRFLTLKGLTLTTSINAGLIATLTPPIMALASFLIFKERVGKSRVLFLGISVIGVVVINYGEINLSGRDSLLGSLLILLSVLCEVSMSVIKKYRGNSIHPLTNTVILYTISLICFLPSFLGSIGEVALDSLKPSYLIALLYYGIFGSALAYIFWSSGVVKVSGFVVSQAFTMIPLTAVILAPMILKESFSTLHIIGGAFVLVGCIAGVIRSK